MKNLLHNLFVRIASAVVILVLITWGAIALLSRHARDYSFEAVGRRDLTATVTASGSVTPDQNVMLAFNMQGRVAAVNTDVGSTTSFGEVLASLDQGSLQASLAGAEADVEAAEARLASLKRGARPEELAVYQQKYTDASTALIVGLKDAYLQTENALTGKADMVFNNGNSANPTIFIRTQSQTEMSSIEYERLRASDTLALWNKSLTTLDAATTDPVILAQARMVSDQALLTVKMFIDHLDAIANNLSVGNSGQTQGQIDSERAAVNAAAQQVTGAASSCQAVEAAWSSARDALTLEQAGSTAEDILSGQAAVDKAESVVSGLQSQIRQSEIISPFAGTVTAVNVKVGEVFVPGISANEGIALLSGGSYKVEAYVPETDVDAIQAGEPTVVTFDGYGPETVFAAHVSLVDPAETIQGGVTAYKVTVMLDEPNDPRVKSGLSAHVAVTTASASQVLAVPASAIITRGDETFVLVGQPGNAATVEQPVTTGIRGADGYTEITSGLNEGDLVASFGLGAN
jgi:HlyD family secretion protein